VADVEVRVSNGPEAPSSSKLCAVHSGIIPPASSATVNCSNPVRGRYIHIQRMTPALFDYFDICEVEFSIVEGKKNKLYINA
jgi:hypothetical protein